MIDSESWERSVTTIASKEPTFLGLFSRARFCSYDFKPQPAGKSPPYYAHSPQSTAQSHSHYHYG